MTEESGGMRGESGGRAAARSRRRCVADVSPTGPGRVRMAPAEGAYIQRPSRNG